MGILLSLAAALSWGVADFFAATVSRRIGSLRALLVTQSLELVGFAVLLTVSGTLTVASSHTWFLALGLGVAQFAGVLMLYRAFEVGTLSIVAPLASSFVVFTALFAWLDGERPAPLALGGAVLLFIGVSLVSQASEDKSDESARPGSREGIWLALAAAICISLVFWQFGILSQQTAPFWPILPLRITTVIGAALFLAVMRPPLPVAPTESKGHGLWPMILIVTIGNCCAWMTFNAALKLAPTTIVSALSSLFSAVTVFMAWLFLRERLAPVQWAGVLVILLGVLMVSL